MENSQKFAPGVFRWHHGRSGKGARRVLRAARKEVRQYATYSCATCCFRVVLDRRGIRRLGFAWIPHRTRPVRPVPRAVLPGRARPRRGAVGALARLLLAPRLDRLLGRSQVAGWLPSACGDHGSVGWLLHPPWAREAQQELSRNCGDAAGRSAHRGGVDHLGRGFAQEHSPGFVAQEGFAAEFMNQDRGGWPLFAEPRRRCFWRTSPVCSRKFARPQSKVPTPATDYNGCSALRSCPTCSSGTSSATTTGG